MVTRYFFFFVEKRELSLKFHRFTGAASFPPLRSARDENKSKNCHPVAVRRIPSTTSSWQSNRVFHGYQSFAASPDQSVHLHNNGIDTDLRQLSPLCVAMMGCRCTAFPFPPYRSRSVTGAKSTARHVSGLNMERRISRGFEITATLPAEPHTPLVDHEDAHAHSGGNKLVPLCSPLPPLDSACCQAFTEVRVSWSHKMIRKR
ncbi:hypothetical protein BJV74DRAFT_419775 [Russula compacta]|nr:hypothetical protein BJV74DRAFT_419775 [Russula compacta]